MSKTSASLLLLLTAALAYVLATWRPVDYHNIGHVRADEFLAYGPIDVVYTWVNGTDPRWKREKEFWHKHWIASLTGQPLPKQSDDTQYVKGKDTSNADNRFRDNEELRYSLRSLEKYAPWIRNIYVVTDGQVPSWLNLEASHLRIVKHSEIFQNKSHLPVFSSPAIEWNLDNIPGLSDKFLYFNDDVFLGSRVHPEDFVSQRGVQKVYFAWEVPLCSPGCWDAWLQNDRCDAQCNVTACDFDMGDCGCTVDPLDGSVSCDQHKIDAILETAPKPPKLQDSVCQGSCHFHWIGDKGCDMSCNVSACGFDGGDCDGTAMFHDHLPTAEVAVNHTLVQVPLAINSTYLNLTAFFGVNGSMRSATHDNAALIRHATVFEQEMSLLLVFGRDEEGDPMTSSAMVTVRGQDADQHDMQLDFELVRGRQSILDGSDVDQVNSFQGAGFATFTNTSVKPRQVRLPLALRQAVWTALDQSPTAVASTVDNEAMEMEGGEAAEKKPEPYLQVLVPVNITNKQFRIGDTVPLAVDTTLRLHNDRGEDDYEWEDYHACQLVIPKRKSKAKRSEVAVDAAGEAKTTGGVGGVEDTKPGDDEVPVLEATDDDKCVVHEDGRLLLRLRLPTHANVHEFTVDTDGSTDGPTPSRDEDPSAGAGEAVLEPALPTDGTSESVTRPQVSDGSVCLSNADKPEKKYCFRLALGHVQPERVVVAMRPKPTLTPEQKKKLARLTPVAYEPYDGVENPAWQECVHHCVDTSRRVIGIRPRKCYKNEYPAILEPPVDPAIKNAEEGRRLACDAKRRRLEEQEARLEQETRERRRGGWSSLLHDLVASTGARVRALLGVETLEATAEDIEDVEYEDVCKPLFEAEREAAAQEITVANAEALLSTDTFGDSLKFVNRLYNRAFGKVSERRRVPSHMPFLLDRRLIREIKTRWPTEVAATSAHRFRHPQDMQFSFSYFHYLLNRHKVHPPTLAFIWREYLDANKNGILDTNEVLTVASLAYGDYPPDAFVDEVKTCLRPPKQEKVRETTTAQGTVLVAETLSPHITLAHLEACANISSRLVQHVRKEKRFELMPEDEVTFHMLSDQYRYAWNQMLGTRARRTKFVCINDDMKFPSTAVAQILHELFLSIWPKRSQFELPYHLQNRYDHIDEYVAAKDRRDMYLYVALTLVLLLIAIFWSELRRLFGFQDIARARAASASQLTAQLEHHQS